MSSIVTQRILVAGVYIMDQLSIFLLKLFTPFSISPDTMFYQSSHSYNGLITVTSLLNPRTPDWTTTPFHSNN